MSSIESAVQQLLNKLKLLSSGYSADAIDLMREADDRLRGLKTPKTTEIEFDVDRDSPDYTRLPKYPGASSLSTLQLPKLASIQPIRASEDKFTGVLPSIKVPAFTYRTPSALKAFSEKAPNIPPLTVKPKLPTLVEPKSISLFTPRYVEVDPITGDLPENAPKPDFEDFDVDFLALYAAEIGHITPVFSSVKTYINNLSQSLTGITTNFLTRMSALMRGEARGLPETWVDNQLAIARQDDAANRQKALADYDSVNVNPIGIPSGQTLFNKLNREFATQQAMSAAIAKILSKRQEIEVDQLQKAMTISKDLISFAAKLKLQEINWKLQSADIVSEGAGEVLNLAIKLLEIETRKLKAFVTYNEIQTRRSEALLTIEKSKLDKLKLDVKYNELLARHDTSQMEAYSLSVGFIETRIRLYESQIDYLAVDLDWRVLAQKTYLSTIEAYQATLKAKLAEHSALKAKIAGDKAKAEAEFTKIDVYNATLTAAIANNEAALSKVKAQMAENRLRFGAYNTTIAAQLEYLSHVQDSVKTAMSAIIKGFDLEYAEQELRIASQELKDRNALDEAYNQMDEDQTNLLVELSDHSIRLSQISAQSQAIIGGATTMAQVATHAYAGLNTLATESIVENL